MPKIKVTLTFEKELSDETFAYYDGPLVLDDYEDLDSIPTMGRIAKCFESDINSGDHRVDEIIDEDFITIEKVEFI